MQSMLLSALLLLPMLCAANLGQQRQDPTVTNTLHRVVGSLVHQDAGTLKQVAAEKQAMKVINVGLARTGTSSFVTAMRQLGLMSYHMKDGVQDTPGHFNLWIAHAELAYEEGGEHVSEEWRSKESMVASREELFDRIALDGFNATADMPMIAYYRELLERYPAARVVMTEHHSGSAEGWAASVLATIGQNGVIFRKRPWKWIPMIRGILRMESWNWAALGVHAHADTHEFNETELAALYRRWNIETARWLASRGHEVLRFKPTDGWRPLCEFLSPALGDASVDAECAALIASGAPFPRANMDLRHVYAVLNAITAFFQLPLAILVLFTATAMAFILNLCFSCCTQFRRHKNKNKTA
jgi:hypothetical protein